MTELLNIPKKARYVDLVVAFTNEKVLKPQQKLVLCVACATFATGRGRERTHCAILPPAKEGSEEERKEVICSSVL
jgi:hypothetical protein